MQRNVIIALLGVILLLAAVLAFVLLRGQPSPVPISVNAAEESVNAAEENAIEPYHQEMDCIDRMLRNNELLANQVEAELARCQAGSRGGAN